MHIAIDARLYGPKENKGLGRYVEQLVKNLEVVDSNNEYFVLLRRTPSSDGAGNWNEYEPQNPRFKKVAVNYRWYSLAEQIFLPFKLWGMKVDLVHFPHFNVPLFCPKKFVVTIHDLIMYKFPDERATSRNKWLYKIKYFLHKVVVRSAVRRAEKVITVSEWTKKDIIREFGVNPGKIRVTYLGFQLSSVNNNVYKIVNNTLEKFGISKPYLLYVGNAYPHKNLENLIKAFEIIREKYNKDLQLVLVGKDDYFYQQLKHQATQASSIIFTDYVSNGELTSLYKNALLYVFPSLYEGFGLPGLEAMSYRLPVVCSRASCLPEIYGEAAVYFDSTDTSDISKKIIQVIEDEGLREALVRKGLERIERYSWRKCAEQTLEVYTHLPND